VLDGTHTNNPHFSKNIVGKHLRLSAFEDEDEDSSLTFRTCTVFLSFFFGVGFSETLGVDEGSALRLFFFFLFSFSDFNDDDIGD
jgi:hypothetical protein